MSYEILAEFYDQLMEDVDYSAWVDYIGEITFSSIQKNIRVLDLACGTGSITLELAKRGYLVQGLDISPEMLAFADEKLFSKGFQVKLTNQNMETFIIEEPVNWVVCCFDSINYLENEDSLRKTFRQVFEALDVNGYFTFDLHTEYYLSKVLGENTFASSDPELSYIWENYYDNENKAITMDLTFFIPDENGLYNRVEETHREYYYDLDEVCEILKETGFIVKGIFADLTSKPLDDKSQRAFIVAQKK